MQQHLDMQCGPVRSVAQANVRPGQTECRIQYSLDLVLCSTPPLLQTKSKGVLITKKIIRIPCIVQELFFYDKKTGQSPYVCIHACIHK